MRTPLSYRLLSHLTLALSCACLVQAELAFMPELQFALIPLLALLLTACLVDGRWVMPAWAANLLGLAIAAGNTWWMAFQLGQMENPLLDVPLPAALVPYFGPLLMALLLVLLFRPRSPDSFWLVQGVGLLQVVLASILVTGSLFGGLLAAYLASALGCLLLHHRHGDWPGTTLMPRTERRGEPFRFGFWLVRWTVGIGLAGLALFLLTPRGEGPVWQPHHYFAALNPERPKPVKTGLSEEINLNRSGTLELDEDEAFTVTASYARGRPKTDLPEDQRWRSYVLDRYDSGRWANTLRLPVRGAGVVVVSSLLPDFGPGQYYLHYTMSPRQAGGFCLADPVRLQASGRVPVQMQGIYLQPLYFDLIDAVLPNFFVDGTDYRYTQVVPPPGLGDDRRPAGNVEVHVRYLVDQYPAGLERWTFALLRRLAADPDYGLEGLEIREDRVIGQRLKPQTRDWERIARALERYLAHSGEYAYSLDLLHKDTSLDPVLDFLLNVKQGHCECYATALALMLRSQGIPAQVVKGFRGAESQGDGDYVIRNRNAHSWVEALVESLPPEQHYDWLTLDPTPQTEALPAPSFSLARWLQECLREGGELWRILVLDYDAEEQVNFWSRLAASTGLIVLASVAGITLTVAALVILLPWLRFRGFWPRPVTAVSFYARLVSLLTRYTSLEPLPTQTPREVGEAAAQVLRNRPATAALASLPGRLAELFYRVRFGGRPLSADEARATERELDQLGTALRR